MPWDGSGNFVLTQDFPMDRDMGRPDSLIDADKFNIEFENIRDGLQNCLALDGQTEPTADLPMAGFSFTGMRAAMGGDEPIIASQVSSGSLDWIGISGGTANALTGSLTFAPTLIAGVRVEGIASLTNTGVATFSLNGGANTPIKRFNGGALQPGDIVAGRPFKLLHDGTQWRLTSLQSGTFSSAPTLDDLSDVIITLPSENQVLRYNDSLAIWENGASNLDALSDVVVSSPTVKQTLRYEGSEWVNDFLGLDDLGDVAISAPSVGHTLRHDGSGFVNALLDLDSLSDVAITASAINHTLRHDGTNFINVLLNLDALSDVSVSAPSAGQTVRWNGSAFVNSLLSIDDLSDAAISTPLTAQVLRYNGSGWVNSGLSYDDLSDVAISTPSTGHVVRYNGSSWVNGTIAAALGYTPINKAGDTFTGNMQISTAWAQLALNKPASGSATTITSSTNGSTRWIVSIGDDSAESGGESGSNIAIHRYSDAGLYVGTPFSMNRSNGQTTFGVTPSVAGNPVWHAGNDGAGSGLDADTVDGAQLAAIAQLNNVSTENGLTFPVGTCLLAYHSVSNTRPTRNTSGTLYTETSTGSGGYYASNLGSMSALTGTWRLCGSQGLYTGGGTATQVGIYQRVS